jgi:hypothetical protein
LWPVSWQQGRQLFRIWRVELMSAFHPKQTFQFLGAGGESTVTFDSFSSQREHFIRREM